MSALEYKDLVGLMKPTIFVDAFESKMGDPEDIIVVSFYVRDQSAASDLMSWFEKGYDFVLDADVSPGELKPNRYLVFAEIRRRSSAAQNVWQLLSDLNTLVEFEPNDWKFVYKEKPYEFSREEFTKKVPCTPNAYLEKTDAGLNEMRIAAGMNPKTRIDYSDPAIQRLRAQAGY